MVSGHSVKNEFWAYAGNGWRQFSYLSPFSTGFTGIGLSSGL
jgi:hypothetical protein